MQKLNTSLICLFFLLLLTDSYLFAQKADPENNNKLFKTNANTKPKGTDTFFINGSNDSLNVNYGVLFKRHQKIKYYVSIDRYYGNQIKVDADGFLINAPSLIDNNLLPKTALLVLKVFDVDNEGKKGFKPEVDKVYVNGHLVKTNKGKDFTLTSGNQRWAINTIRIPIEWLKFPTSIGTETKKPEKANLIEIELDVYDQGWEVKTDWIGIIIRPSPIRPVLMIHGILGSAETWDTFKNFFNNDGIPNLVPPNGFMDNVGSVSSNAFDINQEVIKTKIKFGVDKLNLLVHSKGGLDSRNYLRIYGREDVKRLIQLATPNNGSEKADYLYNLAVLTNFSMPAAEQLTTWWVRDNFNYISQKDTTEGFFRYTKRYNVNESKKPFVYILAGVKYNDERWNLTPPSDNEVPVKSTTLPWNNNNTEPLRSFQIYPYLNKINDGEFPYGHSEMHEKASVYKKVLNILDPFFRTSNSIVNESEMFTNNNNFNNNISDSLQTIYNQIDSLDINETKTKIVRIENTSLAKFLTFGSTDNFSFSLIDPNNNIIDSTNSAYLSSLDEFGKFAGFNITNPLEGNWKLITKSDLTKATVSNNVSIISDKKINVSTNKQYYSTNESFNIFADFNSSSQNIIGAIVNITLLKNNGSIDSLTLFDDGQHSDSLANDGFYANTYQGTDISGSVEIKATGIKDSLIRSNTTHVYIVPNSADFNGNYNENTIDSDGDGLIDTLVIDIGVNVNTAGNYIISGNLNHTQDTTITSASFNSLNSAQLNAGSNNVRLSFVGSEIFNEGYDGPYLLSNLTLTDLQNNLQVDFKEQPFTTQAFTVTQFERPLLSLVGNNTETTFLSNGKISSLVINFDVDFIKEGIYEYNAELTDTNDNYIKWEGGTATIFSSQVGINTLSLFFSGNDINKKRFDGPYLVKNLSINTTDPNLPDANLYVKQLHKTSNYNYGDFTGKLIVVNVINTVTSTPIRNAGLFINQTSGSPFDSYFGFDSTNSSGQVLFSGTNSGDYSLYAVKNSVSSDTINFSTFLDSTSVTINMTIPNTLPVFTNLPDTILIPVNGTETLNVWNFVGDNESSDTTLFFDFSSEPDTLNLSFDNTTGVLSISAADSNFAGNVILNIRADDTFGGVVEDSILIIFSAVTGINDNQNIIPNDFVLYQNYPNPFNPTSNIKFGLPVRSKVEIIIYNILGQQVVKLVNKEFEAGFHVVSFNAAYLSSGVYLYRIKAGNFVQSKKMILLK